jgi:hypothetical protein
LHNYSSNLEAKISTYHLHGKAVMWWDQLKQVEHINENRFTWKWFKKYFHKEYLSEHFYDNKIKELFELRLGSMTMEKYEKKFLGLLNYVRFIDDEKVKIEIFLVDFQPFINKILGMMSPIPLLRPSRRLSTCMSKVREENP